jgi:hypothetical protein
MGHGTPFPDDPDWPKSAEIRQPREPEPLTINEKTIADFTRVVEKRGFWNANQKRSGRRSDPLCQHSPAAGPRTTRMLAHLLRRRSHRTLAWSVGNPFDTDPREWACGFYPGSQPGECTIGTAETSTKPAPISVHGQCSYRSEQRLIFGLGAIKRHGLPRSIFLM